MSNNSVYSFYGEGSKRLPTKNLLLRSIKVDTRSSLIIALVFLLTTPIIIPGQVRALNGETYNYAGQWGGAGSTNGQFNIPWGITVDLNGTVYVSELGGIGRVQVFDENGYYIRNLIDFAGIGGSRVSSLAIDRNGIAYMAIVSPSFQIDYGLVMKVYSNGTLARAWGSHYGNTSFAAPTSIALDSSGNVYVANRKPNNNTIEKFDGNGNFISEFGGTTSPVTFLDIQSIAIDTWGNLFVADGGANCIIKLNYTGVQTAKWGNVGQGNGQFNYPTGIATDILGNVFVVDLNNRVQKFDSTGNFITSWGSLGTGNGQFNGTLGVAANRLGDVFVIEFYNQRIQKFALQTENNLAGVHRGDFFIYDSFITWNSSTPLPAQFAVANDVSYWQNNVTGVLGPMVTMQATLGFKNGTTQSLIATLNITTAEGQQPFIIAPNLGVNDPIGTGFYPSKLRLNETISKQYPDGARELNRLSVVSSTSVDYYFDKKTGVMVEYVYRAYVNQVLFTQTWRLRECNVWAVNNFPPIILPVEVGGQQNAISAVSNSTVSELSFNQSANQIRFIVNGTGGTTGYCNITIPINAISGEISVLKDGSLLVKDVDYTQTSNGTHYLLHIIYTHSAHIITIQAAPSSQPTPTPSISANTPLPTKSPSNQPTQKPTVTPNPTTIPEITTVYLILPIIILTIFIIRLKAATKLSPKMKATN